MPQKKNSMLGTSSRKGRSEHRPTVSVPSTSRAFRARTTKTSRSAGSHCSGRSTTLAHVLRLRQECFPRLSQCLNGCDLARSRDARNGSRRLLGQESVPFRTTHHIAGEAVSLREARMQFDESERRRSYSLHESFEEGAGAAVFSMDASVKRDHCRGNSKERSVEEARSLLAW